MYRTLLTALLAGLLASACSSGPKTFSERMDAQADSYRQLGEQWEDGRDSVKKGEKRVASGNKQVERGRWDIRQGENLIAEGNSEVRTYRQLYQQHSELQQEIAAGITAPAPAGGEQTPLSLREIELAWQAGEQKIRDGNKLLERGRKRVASGEKDIRDGEAMITEGGDKMQQAEARYTTQP